jgi:hypothetical protein
MVSTAAANKQFYNSNNNRALHDDDDDDDWVTSSSNRVRMLLAPDDPLFADLMNDDPRNDPLLTSDEAEAIRAYTVCSDKVNGALRNAHNQVITETIQTQIDNINSGLGKLPSFVGTTFRGCGRDVEDYFDLSPGQVFCDHAFLSTTKDIEVTENFGDADYLFVVTCKQKGKDIGDYDCNADVEDISEEEVLFPPETRFLITKVEECKIWMTEIVEEMNTPGFDDQNDSQAVVDPPASLVVVAEELSMADSFSELGSQWVDGQRRSARLQPQLGSVFVNGLRRSARRLLC